MHETCQGRQNEVLVVVCGREIFIRGTKYFGTEKDHNLSISKRVNLRSSRLFLFLLPAKNFPNFDDLWFFVEQSIGISGISITPALIMSIAHRRPFMTSTCQPKIHYFFYCRRLFFNLIEFILHTLVTPSQKISLPNHPSSLWNRLLPATISKTKDIHPHQIPFKWHHIDQ